MSAVECADRSDEDLVLLSYRRWGLACAERLVGEGAFAIWDGAAQRLACWRDVAGVRPFYYYVVPGRLIVFSSDLQSLVSHPAIPGRLDLPYARSFLESELFQHPTRTLIDGVHKLRPGHILTFDHTGLRVQPYWDPEQIPERTDATDAECIEELRCLLRRSVSERIPASGEGVGAHLSGGLDSSSITVLAADVLRGRDRPLSTFSWAPPRDVVPTLEHDERDLVEAVADSRGLVVNYTQLDKADTIEVAYRDAALRPRVSLHFELKTSRQASDAGVTTILSGWGGDEAITFNGRGYFADLARRGRLRRIQREFKLRSQLQGVSVRSSWKSRVVLPLAPAWIHAFRSGESPALPRELRPEFARLLSEVEPLENRYPREKPGVHRMQVALLKFGHIEARMEAWASHAASLGLTYTFPLLDRRILEFGLSLPGRMFFRDGIKRWLFRTAMEGILPDQVRWNLAKFDSAAGLHREEVVRAPSELHRPPLIQRKQNPFVDVDVILAAQDRWRDSRTVTENVGGATWLAFTSLTP
jgi:asparagine synthase (glutamine-hydrolysing)